MTWRGKAILIVGAALVGLLLFLGVGSKLILLDSFSEIEADDTVKNVQRVLSALEDELSNMSTTAGDYAGWDESYSFIENGNPKYITDNLAPSVYTKLRLNLTVYVNTSGRIVSGRNFVHQTGKPQPFNSYLTPHFTADSPLLRHANFDSSIAGIIMLPEGPMLVASRPILTSEFKGPIRGSLIMGRYFDAAEIERLARTTHLSVTFSRISDERLSVDQRAALQEISPVNPILVRTLGKDLIAGYALVKDIYGRPVMIARVEGPRKIYRQGMETIRYFLFWFTMAVLAFATISSLLFKKLAISRQRGVESEEQLMHQATHDALTGLPNQSLLRDRLKLALAFKKRKQRLVAVILLDLDHFKLINDSLGHPIGDLLLKVVAQRLDSSIRSYDTVARLGGDEFVMVINDLADTQDVISVARNILGLFVAPFHLDGHEVFITPSIGVAISPVDGDGVDALLRNADTAMYQAKEQGRNHYQFFAAEMNRNVNDRLAMETSLRWALDREELLLHYQPRVNLTTGCITGMEALLRWQHPVTGLIPPVKFIPLAEQTGLIIPIGAWVLRTACRQCKQWLDQGLAPLQVSVNLSVRQFKQPNLVEMIQDILRETGLDGQYLELELTESLLMENVEEVIRKLQSLKEMGISLSIDDFGTGYSSLSYLRRFPVDELKIDKSFVDDITCNADGATIVTTIIAMAHSLRLKVVAEGVETAEQLAFLIEHQCDELQGYYFSRPLPIEAFTALLKRGERLMVEYGKILPVTVANGGIVYAESRE